MDTVKRLSFNSIGSIDEEDLFAGLVSLDQDTTTSSPPSTAPCVGWSDIEIPSNSLSFLDDLDFFSAVPPVPSAATPPVAPPAPVSVAPPTAATAARLTLPVPLHRPSTQAAAPVTTSEDESMDDASFVSHLSSDDGMGSPTPNKARSTASSAVTLPTTSPAPSMGSAGDEYHAIEADDDEDYTLFDDELDIVSPRAHTRRRANSTAAAFHSSSARVPKRKRSPRGRRGAAPTAAGRSFAPVAPISHRCAPTAAASRCAADCAPSFPLVRMSASTANARGPAAEDVRCALCSSGYKNGDKWRNVRRIHLHWYRLMQSGALATPSGAPLRLLSEWNTKDPYKAWAKAKDQRVSSHFKVFSAAALGRAFEPNSTDILVHKHCLHAFNFVVKARYDDLVAMTGYSGGPHPDEFGSTYSKRDLDKDLMFDAASSSPRYVNPTRLFRGAGGVAVAPVASASPVAAVSAPMPRHTYGSSAGAGMTAMGVGMGMGMGMTMQVNMTMGVAPQRPVGYQTPVARGLVTATRVLPVRTASAVTPPLKRIRKPMLMRA